MKERCKNTQNQNDVAVAEQKREEKLEIDKSSKKLKYEKRRNQFN